MSTGLTAALRIAFTGYAASDYGQERDLAVDLTGRLLAIDATSGQVLAVSASLTTFTGQGATQAVSDNSNTLEGEGWSGISLETGQTMTTEGT